MHAQIHPTQTFKGVQHMYINDHWRTLGHNNVFIQMEDSIITVKFQSSVDSTTRTNLEQMRGLTPIR